MLSCLNLFFKPVFCLGGGADIVPVPKKIVHEYIYQYTLISTYLLTLEMLNYQF